MSVTAELLSLQNPSSVHGFFPTLKISPFRPSVAALKFETLVKPTRSFGVSIQAPPCGLGLGVGFRRPPPMIVPFAASHEDSHSEIEVEIETDDRNLRSEESQEAWKRALALFKEQALKMQGVSQEAYEIYSKKAMVILKETSEQLQIQAEKARKDLAVIAKEISEEGKVYLSTAAKDYPEPVKEVVETYTSSIDDLTEISKVRDFHVGIPYGLLLSVGGFLIFMLTGSISSIRFGFILGGTLLGLTVLSLRSYKRREPYTLALKGQAAIAALIFLREICLLSQRTSFITSLTTITSGAVVAFYAYRLALDRKQSKGTDLGHGTEN